MKWLAYINQYLLLQTVHNSKDVVPRMPDLKPGTVFPVKFTI